MINKDYNKDDFTLVQENERLLDKPLKTKQLTYFQDAMLRFTKNKYNVIATVILSIFILLSIFVPVITPKTLYNQTNSALTTLPPRVPLLEKIGILDGTKEYKDQPIDYSTIDPVTGLGYPTTGFQIDFIDLDTLTNKGIVGSERSELYVGGTNNLYVNFEQIAFSIITLQSYPMITGHTIEIDVESMDESAVLKVYLSPTNSGGTLTSWDDITLIGTITEAGVHTIDPLLAVTTGTSGYVIIKLELPEASLDGNEFATLNSVEIFNALDVSVVRFEGYTLSNFNLFTINQTNENGRYLRDGAVMTVATFRYNVYDALFADAPRTIGAVEYERILEDNPGMADSIVVDPLNPNAWTFGEGFPLTGVTGTTSITIAGRVYTNYNVMMNGAYALGFEEAPYFLFGTDVFGKDLFTLIWLGLRTSLLLGFLAALINIIVGVIWGATSAYYGGQVDILMERFTDDWYYNRIDRTGLPRFIHLRYL